MEKFIKSKLGPLKGIKADSAYFERSFQTIVSAPQSSGIFSIFGTKLAYSAASVALVLVLVVLSINPLVSPDKPAVGPVASLSGNDLEGEAGNVDFKIHVEEASYFNDSAAKVASALDEIAAE